MIENGVNAFTVQIEIPPAVFHLKELCSVRVLQQINTFAIFLKPLILRALRARKIKGFRKMAIMLTNKNPFGESRCSIAASAFPKWVFVAQL